MGLKLIRFILALAVVTGVSGFGLAKVFLLTEPKIAEQKKMAEEQAKKIIFSQATSFEKKSADGIDYEVASKDGKELGILFKAEKNGYSSNVVSLVGINDDKKIVGIVILNQQETPGLGARMEEIKSNKYIWTFWKKDENSNARPWFQQMYVGLNPAKLNLVKGTEWKDIDETKKQEYVESSTITALSGATISTNANMVSIKEAYAKLAAALESNNSNSKMGSVDSTVVLEQNDSLVTLGQDSASQDSTKVDSLTVGDKNE